VPRHDGGPRRGPLLRRPRGGRQDAPEGTQVRRARKEPGRAQAVRGRKAFLAARGLERLRAEGVLADYPPLSPSALARRAGASDLTLAHELAVMDVRVAFHSAARGHPTLSVAEFGTWPRLHQFPAADPGRGPVRPDGFVRIRDSDADGGPSEHSLFLEVDRSTESLDTLAAKALDYLSFYRSGGFAERNGAPRSAFKEHPFRVLMVLETEERRNNVAERLLRGTPPILTQVMLSTIGEVRADPFGPIWMRPPRLPRRDKGHAVRARHGIGTGGAPQAERPRRVRGGAREEAEPPSARGLVGPGPSNGQARPRKSGPFGPLDSSGQALPQLLARKVGRQARAAEPHQPHRPLRREVVEEGRGGRLPVRAAVRHHPYPPAPGDARDDEPSLALGAVVVEERHRVAVAVLVQPPHGGQARDDDEVVAGRPDAVAVVEQEIPPELEPDALPLPRLGERVARLPVVNRAPGVRAGVADEPALRVVQRYRDHAPQEPPRAEPRAEVDDRLQIEPTSREGGVVVLQPLQLEVEGRVHERLPGLLPRGWRRRTRRLRRMRPRFLPVRAQRPLERDADLPQRRPVLGIDAPIRAANSIRFPEAPQPKHRKMPRPRCAENGATFGRPPCDGRGHGPWCCSPVLRISTLYRPSTSSNLSRARSSLKLTHVLSL
jgi:hypothetical protein